MIVFGHVANILVFISANLILFCPAGAVSPGLYDKLTREQFLHLDTEVSQYYVESYAELDARENNQTSTYDSQLLRSIKALRHTIVTSHFDYRYSSNDTLWKSMGSRVEAKRCKHQLQILNQLARKMLHDSQVGQETPLSIVDFFEASGKTGSGILNGNFAWLGSYASCERAKIPAQTLLRSLGATGVANLSDTHLDIKGRYCVAHLRAKSWPRWDIYFADRLTLKRGICLPASCHSALHERQEDDGAEIRLLVDRLARFGLLPPFSDEQRYETQTIYCLPDEDSPLRQLDLGAKLFILFALSWLLLTAYLNLRYKWRVEAMQRLRDTIDIKMIINEKASHNGADDGDLGPAAGTKMTKQATEASSGELETSHYLGLSGLGSQRSENGSAQSSACSTPLPSDLEDDDSDPNHLIEPFRTRTKKKKKTTCKANANYDYKSEQVRGAAAAKMEDAGSSAAPSEPFDFVRDFSIESNLSWLLRPRKGMRARCDQKRAQSHKLDHRGSNVVIQQQAGGASSVVRRASNSNEALIKELQDGHESSKVTVKVSGAGGPGSEATPSEKRVNIDIMDGLKVIATMWIVFGHTFMFFFSIVEDLRFGAERMFDVTITTTLNTLQVVGLFYVTTGCLLTYISFSRAKRAQLLNPLFWLLVLLGRYIRLMPPYLLVFWFARHVAQHTGSGRDWLDYRTDEEHPRGFCGQESWLVPLTMSAADVKIPMDCVPQAWYLSDDFRTLLVLPAYVFLLAKSALLGYSAVFATIVYSTCRLAAILARANIDYKIVLLWQPHVYALMVDRLHDVYTDFFVRMSTYLLGVVVGHLLYLYEIRQIKAWPVWLDMRLAMLTASGFFFGAQVLSSPWLNQFLPARDDLNSDLVVWLIPLFKTAMELSLAVIILLLVTGHGSRWARAVLASQLMKTLSNISYAVFLIHVEIMYKLPSTRFESNYWQLVLYATFLIAISHVAAFFVHLLYEMPLNNVARRVLKRAAKLVS